MNTNPEYYFVTSENLEEPSRIHFTLDDAINDPKALYIVTFDANGDRVRAFMYDGETKSYTEEF